MSHLDDAVLQLLRDNDLKYGDPIPPAALEQLAGLVSGTIPLEPIPAPASSRPEILESVAEPEPQTAHRTATEPETPIPAPRRSRAPGRARGNRTPPPSGKPSRARRLLTYFDPPELWTDRRPSLKDVWMYARHGEWTGTSTLGRVWGTVYALLVAMPLLGALGLAGWVVERFARLATAAAVTALVSLTPPGGYVRRALASLLQLIADLIA